MPDDAVTFSVGCLVMLSHSLQDAQGSLSINNVQVFFWQFLSSFFSPPRFFKEGSSVVKFFFNPVACRG
jgi:hypothetical protein